MKRWTKKEFIEIVDPCGYRFRIWWWFFWHRYVTLLDIVSQKDIPADIKQSVVFDLDLKLWRRAVDESFVGMRGLAKNIRKELENETQ